MVRRAALLLAGLLLFAACDEDSGKAAATPVKGKAAVTLDLINFSYEFRDGRHTYNHDRRFTESGGVGANITRGKVCVRDGAECVDALVDYRVDANQTLLQKGHHVATPMAQDTITLHYWGKDDAGNKFELHKVYKTDGEKIVPQ